MKGIDISSYQGNVDFNQVKANGVEIVIIKASEGMTWKDSNFAAYYDGAKAVGLKVGAYHFLRANESESEVSNFLDVIGNRKFDCKLIIDMEIDYKSTGTNSALVRKFADILISKGYEVCLYTGEYFYNHNLNDTVKDLPLWVAKYSETKPSVGCDYIGWQYTSKGAVPGIAGNVDINNFSEAILNAPVVPQVQAKVFNPKVYSFQVNANIQGIRDKNGNKLDEDGELGELTESVIDNPAAIIRPGDEKPLVGVFQTFSGCTVDYKYWNPNVAPGWHETYDAVGGFQESHGLKKDYIVGKNTWREFLK